MQSYYAPILTAGLHSIGIQRNLPQVLVYGPIRHQGLGVRDPWAIQLIEHLHCILRHCTRDTITGHLINANLENLTLELGSSLPFWELDYDTWHHWTTDSWITNTWRDLSSTPLTLKGPLTLPTAQRENDTFLMEAFLQMDLSIDDLISLNDVRMFKHVLRLSDMCSADGTKILASFLTASTPSHASAHKWPRCYRPYATQIAFWKQTVLHCFVGQHPTHR
jgi:hypothetical protein